MIELICGLHNIKKRNYPAVVTIGNFDGLHQGHQAIINQLNDYAHKLGLPSCVILFEPHPQEYFQKQKAPPRLMRLREKIQILEKLNVSQVLCLNFNKHLAEMPAQQFIEQILLKRLHTKLLIVGDDFRFGKARQGDFSLLKSYERSHGITIKSTPTILWAGKRVGSSRIRDALQEGDFDLALILLTRPFTMEGRVSHGDKRGRLLGFPTANIQLHRMVSPLHGVFLVSVSGIGGQALSALANCGKRPTIDGVKDLLEVHLLNFNQDIYGAHLKIKFLKKIRNEKKFSSLNELKKQIFLDIAYAKKYFNL